MRYSYISSACQVGVENIRERMTAGAEAAERMARQRVELATQASKLRHQLAYEQRRDVAGPVAAAERLLDADRRRALVLQEEVAQQQAARSRLEQELAGQVRAHPAPVTFLI